MSLLEYQELVHGQINLGLVFKKFNEVKIWYGELNVGRCNLKIFAMSRLKCFALFLFVSCAATKNDYSDKIHKHLMDYENKYKDSIYNYGVPIDSILTKPSFFSICNPSMSPASN